MTDATDKIFDLTTPLSRSAGETAADLLREAILDGRLAPAQRLKENVLALDLGISRTPLRQALRQLESEGLVVSVHNRGTFVREYGTEDIAEIYELRGVLEPHAARRAAERCTPSERDELRASSDRYRTPGLDTPAFNRENLVFHRLVLRISGSERLAAMARTVIELPLIYKMHVLDAEDVRREAQRYHELLTDAIGEHRPDDAAQLMADHVRQSRELILQSLPAAAGKERRG